MKWAWRYRVLLYVRNAVWLLPTLSIVAALLAVRLARLAEAAYPAPSGLAPGAAQTVLITLASSMFTFVVFVCSALLLALQLASAQLTPRVISVVFRDPVIKVSLGLFVFTFTFIVATVVRIDATVPLLSTRVGVYSCIASLGYFFYMIDHVGRLLRPNEVLRRVAQRGRRVIESVYPHRLRDSPPAPREPERPAGPGPTRTVPARAYGVVLACDIQGIVALAERCNGVIELVPQVGDFIARGDPLFRVPDACTPRIGDELTAMVALGQERTIDQDPTFAFRIIVDVACKALSPAINDPTTAVLAIDQLHHLLRTVGQRHLDDERIRDARGRVRLVYRTPAWQDFVRLAVTEIRQYGRDSIQVVRRLRALLENLIEFLPASRLPLLRQELEILQRSAARFFTEPEDQALAAVSDSQGVGGTTQAGSDDGMHLPEGAVARMT